MLEAGGTKGCASSRNPKRVQRLSVQWAWGYPELSFRCPSYPHLQWTHAWLGSTLVVLLLAPSTLGTGLFPHERSDRLYYLCGNCMCCLVLTSLGLVLYRKMGINALPYLKSYCRSHSGHYSSNVG